MKSLDAIGKRKSENDGAWITLQACKFKWNKVDIPKVKRYGTETMSQFYTNRGFTEIGYVPISRVIFKFHR